MPVAARTGHLFATVPLAIVPHPREELVPAAHAMTWYALRAQPQPKDTATTSPQIPAGPRDENPEIVTSA